jgi:predicted transcriptional regulator
MLTVRVDEVTAEAVDYLVSAGDVPKSQVIRDAILDMARRVRRAELLKEAERLRDDPIDLAACREALADMEELRAW